MHEDGLHYEQGRAIRALREAKGWTQKDCAEAAGVVPQTIRNIELGHVRQSRNWVKVCHALGVHPAEVIIKADEANVGPMHPATGELVRYVMERRGMSEHDLMVAMGVDREDLERLLDGDGGPFLWGRAATALMIPTEAFDEALDGGFHRAVVIMEQRRTRRTTNG